MTTKTYGQMCSMARALDLLGDRWTMLVIRELLLGPQRFKRLLSALAGVGANRLSDRLKRLEEAGVVGRVAMDETPSASGYELTDFGERLRVPLVSLGLWGLDLPVDERIDPSTLRADLVAMSLAGTQIERLDPARCESVEFRVGAEVFHLRLRDGRYSARSGPDPEALAHVACDVEAFVDLARGAMPPAQAVREGRVKILEGVEAAFTDIFRVLTYVPAVPPVALT